MMRLFEHSGCRAIRCVGLTCAFFGLLLLLAAFWAGSISAHEHTLPAYTTSLGPEPDSAGAGIERPAETGQAAGCRLALRLTDRSTDTCTTSCPASSALSRRSSSNHSRSHKDLRSQSKCGHHSMSAQAILTWLTRQLQALFMQDRVQLVAEIRSELESRTDHSLTSPNGWRAGLPNSIKTLTI
jgi:hypothetical protein